MMLYQVARDIQQVYVKRTHVNEYISGYSVHIVGENEERQRNKEHSLTHTFVPHPVLCKDLS